MLDMIADKSVYIIGVIGFLAFLVSLLVQVTKELPGIVRIPTKLYVILVAVVICVLALFIAAAYLDKAVLWYYIVLAVIGAFVVAFISMYGWDTLKELYLRFMGKDDLP